MARIRSIHPSLFTDEAFASLSMAAKVLAIGLWTEADDHGVFEWKPISIKMRIFPADHVDVAKLLDELASSNLVKMADMNGRQYGLVRNFMRFQRPRRPSYVHPITSEYGHYVGLRGPIPDIVGNDGDQCNPLPTMSGNSPQMESSRRKEPIQEGSTLSEVVVGEGQTAQVVPLAGRNGR